MGYELVDADGEVNATVSSFNIGSIRTLRQELERHQVGLYPELNLFIDNGISHNPMLLATEATAMWDRMQDKDVRDTLSDLANAARASKSFLAMVM